MSAEPGLIEGFYGPPWSWQQRTDTVTFLSGHGYRFYLYAPKGDAFLRRRWQESHPDREAGALAELAAHCASCGIRFGVGLSPYDAFRDFDARARTALAGKLAFFDELGVTDVAILFDDMRGDVPDLAARQAELVEWAAARTGARRVLMCPSYYSDDPLLDRIFGPRPDGYLRELGRRLDPAIEMFWTGTAICASAHEPAHFERVADEMRRRPLLWDNYPVNDTARMSQHLHLRGFSGRPAELGERISGHAINGALQPTLTRIPALTLLRSYRDGPGYAPERATAEAAGLVLGERPGRMLVEDIPLLQDVGLAALGARTRALRSRYAAIDHDGAREVVAWLDGDYRVTDAMIRAQ